MTRVKLLKIDDFSPEEYKSFREFISTEKCLRIDRFKFVEDYRRSLLADVLSRKMIGDVTGIGAKELDIRIGEYGKPYVFNKADVYFNVSHSGEYVACIVSDGPCGIDIERMDEVDLSVARRFFTGNEYCCITNCPKEQMADRFYEIWTAKEAYIKLEGRGLGIKLDSFEVTIRDGRYVIDIGGEKEYRVTVKDIDKQYKLSFICMDDNTEHFEIGRGDMYEI